MSITVILPDRTFDHEVADSSFVRAAYWARQYCESYVNYEVVWVGDVSNEHDQMGEYVFEDERDAFLFKLKWL